MALQTKGPRFSYHVLRYRRKPEVITDAGGASDSSTLYGVAGNLEQDQCAGEVFTRAEGDKNGAGNNFMEYLCKQCLQTSCRSLGEMLYVRQESSVPDFFKYIDIERQQETRVDAY